MLANPLDFPHDRPDGFAPIEDDEDFDPRRHLALEASDTVVPLSALGYSEAEIARCASPVAVTGACRILSEEGVAVLQRICRRLERDATEGRRIARMVRGGAHRSRFIRGPLPQPEVTGFVSTVPDAAGAAPCRRSWGTSTMRPPT
ncbi:MAG: hypothetical protein R3F55_10295 [Alphaproteobacteria bacterium]